MEIPALRGDGYVPCETEIGLACADLYEIGEDIDLCADAPSSEDAFSVLTDYDLAAVRTEADADALAEAYAAGLSIPTCTAPVVELACWQRATRKSPEAGLRAA